MIRSFHVIAAVICASSMGAFATPPEHVGTWVGTMKGKVHTYSHPAVEKLKDTITLTLTADDKFTIMGGRFNNSGSTAIGSNNGAVLFTGPLVGAMTLHFDGKGGAKGLVTYASTDSGFLSIEGKVSLKKQ